LGVGQQNKTKQNKNKITKQNHKTKSQNKITKQNHKTKSQNKITQQNHKTKSQTKITKRWRGNPGALRDRRPCGGLPQLRACVTSGA